MINRTNIKIHTISLKGMPTSAGISKYFKDNNIRYYAYAIKHLGTVLKFGESTRFQPGKSWGERVKRQAENIDGWGKKYRSESGKEIIAICEDVYRQQSMRVTKDDVTLEIYDFANHIPDGWRTIEEEVKMFEAELITGYSNNFKELPIGNIKNEAHQNEKARLDETRATLFDW
jgi:hypothetical protein